MIRVGLELLGSLNFEDDTFIQLPYGSWIRLLLRSGVGSCLLDPIIQGYFVYIQSTSG